MAKGHSIHFGINKVDRHRYDGWDGFLASCEADAQAMFDIATAQQFTSSSLFLTQEATKSAFLSAMAELQEKAEAGDLVFISFSGHGGSIMDRDDGEELDGRDETWCFYDGQIVDDKILALLKKFKPDVRVLIVSDSCHSGTVIKYNNWLKKHSLPKENKLSFKKEKEDVQACVLLLSSCQDDEYSIAGTNYSRYTEILLEVWNEGEFDGTYPDFHQSIVSAHPFGQTPNYLTIGPPNDIFFASKPFTL